MCQYSLEGRKTRDAKEGETVYSVTDHHGAFCDKPNSTTRAAKSLICVKYGTRLTIESLELRTNMSPYVDLIGKRHVVTLDSNNVRGGGDDYGDYIRFADGRRISSAFVASPLYVCVSHKLFRGRKQFNDHVQRFKPLTGKKGLATVKKAIREAIATTPDEKPARAPRVKA